MDSFPHFFSGALMIFIIYTLHNSLFSTWGLQVLQVQQELLMLQTSIPSVSQERIFYRLNKGTKEGYRWDSFVNNTCLRGDTAILSTKLFLGLVTFLFQGLL